MIAATAKRRTYVQTVCSRCLEVSVRMPPMGVS